ncbi:MAG: DUF3604 domain-containing protein, partial [Candidatus Dadabacteria bacterium]|nr:DUF3604 domain-containing protein [Candidatus Dadabacteria bacterium]
MNIYILLAGVFSLTFLTNFFPMSISAQEVSFEITEDRVRCDNFDPLRQPFFGTTHLHTGLSFDASVRFVETTPRGAYRFAKGLETLTLPNPSGFQTVEVMIDRPTDWGMVTDHSEFFGEMGICKDFLGIDAPGRRSMDCRMINGFYWGPNVLPDPSFQRSSASAAFRMLTPMNVSPSSKNTHLPLCLNSPEECALSELAVWEEFQAAAEEEYDRSSNCSFTTFIAYENTSTPSGTNWHRNVIFRNDRVLRTPITAIDMAVEVNENPLEGGPDGVGVPPNFFGIPLPPPFETLLTHPLPEKLWLGLERDCLLGGNITDGIGTRCDVTVIPHNSNLGGGQPPFIPPQWFDPPDIINARNKARFESLVEIYQDKGSSECRYDPRFKAGVETTDEFCNFELLDTTSLLASVGAGGGSSSGPPPPSDFNERSYVRNILKDGLALAQNSPHGFNPFKAGIVASSDTHTGTMGWHPENALWPGHLGIDDAIPVRSPSTIQNSSGGHSVVWAEENSRDSIFEALRRKETYGTSGTRIVVRFFGGWDFPEDLCSEDFVPVGYSDGVPMGGDLPLAPEGAGGPRFIAAAWMDDFIGTPLEQIHIIKGWVDSEGNTPEKVLRIAGKRGKPNRPQAGVDNACNLKGEGFSSLCAVCEDTDFDPSEWAFYYVRVLERPVCRYSTLYCQENFGLNPLTPSRCKQDLAELEANDPAMAVNATQCCNNERSDTIV